MELANGRTPFEGQKPLKVKERGRERERERQREREREEKKPLKARV